MLTAVLTSAIVANLVSLVAVRAILTSLTILAIEPAAAPGKAVATRLVLISALLTTSAISSVLITLFGVSPAAAIFVLA